MVAGARTFSIEETLLEPPAINPPPTRHALFVFLIALAALLHVTTIGWGDLYGHTEGQYAGAAREMIEAHQWLSPTNDGLQRLQKPPLLYWLIIASFKFFGASAAAARLPIALGMIATVAVTFLIGERLADYWRGFLAGLIYLCSCGAFLLGRIIMPEPVFSAFVAGAIFCGVCGYQRRRFRRFWFLGFWLCAAFACLTKGLHGLICPAAVFLLLALLYREARLRFRLLLHWSYLSIFLLMVAPWYIWAEWHFPGFLRQLVGVEWLGHLHAAPDVPGSDNGVPRLQFIALLVVSMVGRALARGALGMAASDAAAHNRIYGCFAPLLDECVFFAAASPRTAPGLLFNEYVERICALGGGGVAKNAGATAPGRRELAQPCRNRHRFPGAAAEGARTN